MNSLKLVLFCIWAVCLGLPHVITKTAAAESLETQDAGANGSQNLTTKERVNNGTVTIVTDSIGSSSARMAADMAAVLDDGQSLRVLPIVGHSGLQNILDVLFLRGVDFSIVQSDVLQYATDPSRYPNAQSQIRYIAKLHNDELHIVADQSISTLDDLVGKRVNFGPESSSVDITAGAVFEAHGVDVEITRFDEFDALDKLKRGDIDAMAYLSGKPAPIFSDVTRDSRLHLVPIPFDALMLDYLPSSFTAADYPQMISEQQEVPTVAVPVLLAVYNLRPGTTRYGNVVNFIDTFFSSFEEMRESSRHGKWRDVNIYADVPGWDRFAPADRWIAARSLEIAASSEERPSSAANVLENAEDSGEATQPRGDGEVILEEFLGWEQ